MKKAVISALVCAAVFGLLLLAGCPDLDGGAPPPSQTTDAQTPVISQHPADRIYNPGDIPSALTVSASVTDSGTLSYRWYRADTEEGAGGEVDADDDSYTPEIPASVDDDEHTWYWAVVTNTNNSVNGGKTAQITSNKAKITVTNTIFINAETPNITEHPKDAVYTIFDTEAAALTVAHDSVSDSGTIGYQWYSAGTATGAGTPINGATNAGYTPSLGGNAGTVFYYVEVTNINQSVNGNQLGIARSNAAEIRITAPELPLIYKVNEAGDAFIGTFFDGETTAPAILGGGGYPNNGSTVHQNGTITAAIVDAWNSSGARKAVSTMGWTDRTNNGWIDLGATV